MPSFSCSPSVQLQWLNALFSEALRAATTEPSVSEQINLTQAKNGFVKAQLEVPCRATSSSWLIKQSERPEKERAISRHVTKCWSTVLSGLASAVWKVMLSSGMWIPVRVSASFVVV